MADQNMNITSPVKVVSDSKAQVAFDLMKYIYSSIPDDDKPKDKAYWLGLYRQCYKAADGFTLKSILQDE